MKQHGDDANNIEKSFKVLRKCRGKYECLLFERLFIKELKPSLNKQLDSIRLKLFSSLLAYLYGFVSFIVGLLV